MPFADVTKPIIVQASKVLTANVDNYLRRMCIVSNGGSNLNVGTSKIVHQSDYADILSTEVSATEYSTKLNKLLTGFFAYAGDKECCVVEVGAFNSSTNPISLQVSRLQDFIGSQVNRSYCHLVPDEWYYPPKATILTPNTTLTVQYKLTALRLPIPEGETLPEGVSQPNPEGQLDIQTNASDYTVEIADETVVSFDKESHKLTALKEGTTDITITANVNTSNSNSQNATAVVSVKVGKWDEELVLTDTEQAETSEKVVVTTNNQPTEGERDLAFSQLAAKYINLEDKVFFFIRLKDNEDPSISEAWQLYKSKKSVFGVYCNLNNPPYPLTAVILGICASSKFDIGDTQVGTPLNYKVLRGLTPNQLTHTFANNIIQSSANFAGTLAGNPVVLNGRYADGTAWEYYYFWDLIEFEIKKNLETLLLNSANSSNNALPYTQQGIDIMLSSIKGTLLLWQSRGIVTSFAEGYDPVTNTQINPGQIKTIDFYTYIQNNPLDYANEIYKGFSFYLMVGRFVRQIYIDVTLN